MEEKLDRIFEKFTELKIINKACLNISYGEFSYTNEYNMTTGQPYLLASVSKLFTTAVILKLITEGRLALDDNILEFFSESELEKLNTIGGIDHTKSVRVKNLLYQNSGFPDPEINLRMADRIKAPPLTFDELLSKTKETQGIFEPASQKAYYSSVNFILLGEIAERIEKDKLSRVFENNIFKPLAMNETFLAGTFEKLVGTYFKNEYIDISSRVAASKGAGGGVGSSEDLMVFLKAFFNGKLFDKSLIEKSDYLPLPRSFGPIEYGLGHMGVKVNNSRYIGHNGITGSFAFARPKEDFYISGTFNQLARQSLSVDLVKDLDSLFF